MSSLPRKRVARRTLTAAPPPPAAAGTPARFDPTQITRKGQMMAIALAQVSRLGNESSASVMATDTYWLRDLSELLEPFRIAAFGGFFASVHVMDTDRNTWTRLPDMPFGLGLCGAAVAPDGRIFVIGGVRMYVGAMGVPTSDVYALTPGAGAWTVMPAMTMPRAGPGVGVVGDRIFVFGGHWSPDMAHPSRYKINSSCEVFSTTENRWLPLYVPPLSTPRTDMCAAVVGHRIFIIGGIPDDAVGLAEDRPLASVDVFDTTTLTRTAGRPMPTARYGAAAAVVDGRYVWVIGGVVRRSKSISPFADPIFTKVIEVLDTETGEWSTPAVRLSAARGNAKAVSSGHRIFVLGGRSRAAGMSDSVSVLNTDTLEWSDAARIPIPMDHHAVVGY